MNTFWSQVRRIWIVTLCVVWSVYPSLVEAQVAIGNAQKVVNMVIGTLAQQRRDIVLNDQVFQNEVIQTGAESAARLIFEDETTVSIGANSTLTLDKFVFDPDPAKSSAVMSLTRGVMRFTSGKMAKKAFTIRTPTSVIGIRGTSFEVVVLPDGTTFVSVYEGLVIVTAAGVTVTVGPGLATTVPPGGVPGAPTPPGPTPTSVTQMNASLGEVSPGIAGAQPTGIGVGGVAAGIAAAAILGVVIGVVAGDDDEEAAVTTVTVTGPQD